MKTGFLEARSLDDTLESAEGEHVRARPAIAGVVVGSLGLRPTFEVFGLAAAALALVAALQAWRTRLPTQRARHRLAYQATR